MQKFQLHYLNKLPWKYHKNSGSSGIPHSVKFVSETTKIIVFGIKTLAGLVLG